jgi:excisionase family DNA binding protein
LNAPQYCSIEEIAEHFNVGVGKVRELVGLGMPCSRLGYRTLRFNKEQCNEWVENYQPKSE